MDAGSNGMAEMEQAQEHAQQPQAEEQYVPQSKVNELMSGAKRKAEERSKAELEQLRQEHERLKQAYEQAQQQAGSMGGMQQQPDIEQIRKQVYDDVLSDFEKQQREYQEQQTQEQAQKIAQTFHTRMARGKDKYDDFDSVMQKFNPAAFPNLVSLATQVDNTEDVLYEAVKNPTKWATLSTLATHDPQAGLHALQEMSDSIQRNEQAQANYQPVQEPLNRIQSSPKASDTGSPNSVADFKKLFRG